MKKKTVTIQDLKQIIISERNTAVMAMKNSERKRYLDYYAAKIHAFDSIINHIEKLKL